MLTSKFNSPLSAVIFAVIVLIFAHLSIGNAADTPRSRPDILLLMPDQMRGDCLSAVGHPVVRTPHLDELARGGALFRRAYATCPSCIPSRASLLTGLYPSTSGVVGYAARPIPYPTLPKLLADDGYATLMVGRNMHQLPKNELYGYQRQILGSTYVADDDYDQALRKAAPETEGIRPFFAKLGLTANGWAASAWPLAEDLHPTAWIVQQSLAVLKQIPTEQPLFLTASFYAPHPPLFPPKHYFDYYLRQKLPAPAHGDWVDWKSLTTKGNKTGDRVLLEGETLRNCQAGYFGLIEQLDDQILPLMTEFKERSKKAGRPWVIIFITDHGEMLGDNGYYRKCEPYEGSDNIPFIIAGSPELGFKAGLRPAQTVCLEDVMPTLLDLAGAKIPQLMDGISLVPTLRGDKRTLREWLHMEHAPCYNKPQSFQALTDGHFKYIWRPLDGSEQLFNLENDPHEEHDLAKSEPGETERWRARLIKLLVNRPEGFTDGVKLIAGRPYPALQERP